MSRWTDADIFRAIRNSVDPDGNWLVVMSYTNAGRLSDEDIRAVIAYVRRLPAIGRPTDNPPDHLNLLGIAMLGAGMSEEPITPIPAPRPMDPLKVRLGERLFGDPRLSRDNSRSCLSCHDLRSNGATRVSHETRG